ncbi:MAG: hypothetical protein KF775_09255 [Cyclobacteriaceae bacterium]|nr:hypothetical protein [Cyclobacteriaceae bacterium]
MNKLVVELYQKKLPTQLAACVQSVNKSSYSTLYISKISNEDFENLVSRTKSTARQLGGIAIYERKKEGAVDLGFAYVEGYLVFSQSPILIENAIRVYNATPSPNYRVRNPRLFEFVTIKSDAGNLWVNYKQLSQTKIPLFAMLNKIPVLKDLAVSAVLDISMSNERISLSGFTLDTVGKQWGLYRFQNQTPVKIEAVQYVPGNTQAFVHFGISNSRTFFSEDPADSLRMQSEEIGVCMLEQDRYVIILKLKQNSAIRNSEYVESYSGYDVLKMPGRALNLMEALLPRGEYVYFMQKDKYIFVAEEASELRNLIDAIEADETWGRSVSFQNFFESSLQEGNVSFFFTPRTLFGEGTADWKPLLDSMGLSATQWGSIQFNSLDNHFYTNANFVLGAKEKSSKTVTSKKSFQLSSSPASVVNVKNHVDGSGELLLQDSTFKLFLFSMKEGVQWMYALPEKVVQVQQVDYFRNGKLQYLITTASYTYLIDRLGRDVQGFPVKPNLKFRFSEVVDYDKSKNYRFLFGGVDGDIYLFDKAMKPLEGWSPKKLPATLLFSPRHYRIGGKDYFVTLTTDGQIHLLNRKGDYENGFPLQAAKNISGDYYLYVGNSLATSFIYFTTPTGEVHKIGLDGKRVSEYLVRGKQSVFFLVATLAGKSEFFVVRIDADKLAVFNKTNQLIFERENPGSQRIIPGAIMVGDEPYYCFFDVEQNLSYVYDKKGSVMLGKPLETTLYPVFNIDSKSKKATIFTIYENQVSVTPLN